MDELFNDYLRRPGFVEPLAAKFCNGTTVTCEGLSQWGSQNLAQQGYNSTQILRSYYGNVETVLNAPIRGITTSYPGTPLRNGSTGPYVVVIQTSLNRISQNYPAIPKIPAVDGIYGSRTEAAVRAFQQIFNLNPDGIVGPATWYAIVRIYTAVTRLSELRSQGQRFYAINWTAPNALQQGSTGDKVRQLQYMLSVLSEYIRSIPPLTIDGIYGSATRAAVLAAQRRFGLPETGVVDPATWDEIYDQFAGIENTSLRQRSSAVNSSEAVRAGNFTSQRPIRPRPNGQNSTTQQYNASSSITQFPGNDLAMGSKDPVMQEVMP